MKRHHHRTLLEGFSTHMSLDSRVLALYITEGASMYNITHTVGHLSEKSVIYILKLSGRLASIIGFCWHRTISRTGGRGRGRRQKASISKVIIQTARCQVRINNKKFKLFQVLESPQNISNTIFPWIVVSTTILFWISKLLLIVVVKLANYPTYLA